MLNLQYFLGANSPGGFYSLYHELLPTEQAKAIYILKGGAGCGKSSLMRRVARHAEAVGLDTVSILCSGDPGFSGCPHLPPAGNRNCGRYRASYRGAPLSRCSGELCGPGQLL